ncbi:hypothetical protein B0H13DRAFT_1870599 [Mycena leptocephala]|nr:hypothetical protein B0H13DRAFT_1870599 [Mycena leptocephala]
MTQRTLPDDQPYRHICERSRGLRDSILEESSLNCCNAYVLRCTHGYNTLVRPASERKLTAVILHLTRGYTQSSGAISCPVCQDLEPACGAVELCSRLSLQEIFSSKGLASGPGIRLHYIFSTIEAFLRRALTTRCVGPTFKSFSQFPIIAKKLIRIELLQILRSIEHLMSYDPIHTQRQSRTEIFKAKLRNFGSNIHALLGQSRQPPLQVIPEAMVQRY